MLRWSYYVLDVPLIDVLVFTSPQDNILLRFTELPLS